MGETGGASSHDLDEGIQMLGFVVILDGASVHVVQVVVGLEGVDID